jgi:hypothetical protein
VAVVPAASVAVTVKVCGPVASELYCWVVGPVQRPAGALSRRQLTVEIWSLTANANEAVVWVVGLAGSEAGVIVTAIGAGSSLITESVPVRAVKGG